MPTEATTTKKCSACKLDKFVTEFSKDASKRDGLYTRCKACKKKATEETVQVKRQTISDEATLVREEPDRKTELAQANRAALLELIGNHQTEFASLVDLHRRKLNVELMKPDWQKKSSRNS